MSAYDEDSFSTESYHVDSHWFTELVYAGWREIKVLSLKIARTLTFNLRIR